MPPSPATVASPSRSHLVPKQKKEGECLVLDPPRGTSSTSTVNASFSPTPYSAGSACDVVQLTVHIRLDCIWFKRNYEAIVMVVEVTSRLLSTHRLRTSYFVWDGSFYQQTDGVAMGSPLSPVVANLFMEQFESLAIETAVDKHTVWWRYVDDTFVVWPHGRYKLGRFLEHLNGVHPNIQFTMEPEDNGFNRDRARATTGVFRTPTHTDSYLHNQSNHHPGQKNTMVCT
ncbi:hypothetical protein Trydic_g19635 [Trypoxylus dichotomus]